MLQSRWVDTHSHIYQEDFETDIDDVMTKAQQAGISRILLPNIDLRSIEPMHRLCENYPGICFPMMGLHPTSIKADSQIELKEIKSFFLKRKYIAVGEIGIDLYWDKTFLKEQIHAFEEQLRWSLEFNLPVVIHTRDSFPYVFESLQNIGIEKVRGVFHSFGGSREELEQILPFENFMIGINGVVTFKNSKLRDYLALAPLSRIILETDAPYLTPVPYRGKRNEPSFLLKTAETVAEVYGVSKKSLANQTSTNANRLFGI